ncbi:hypothetical protein [Cohnella terricola]|uniref:DUF3679 domain-containing protein n=1 Tax=Cohnella terricola TaxID=1289167 RepID=A0A559JKU6_9BACL|nr:hypothetical protein [Cohnella terricola]TVY00503.1 hypothetical protein FPZ45_10770 [Cohnella terricola]
MRRDTFKLLIMALILGFAVLYGMELSSRGIENVKGPWETQDPSLGRSSSSSEEDWTLPPTGKKTDPSSVKKRFPAAGEESPFGEDSEQFGIPRNDREPIVDRVSGKTAEVLHDLSRGGIRFVVSLFDKVLG